MFWVRFSLYLASWLSDFDLLFLCVWFLAPLFFPQIMGGGARPLIPPPGSAPGAGRHHEVGKPVCTRALKREGCLKYMHTAVVQYCEIPDI